jgi:excisionase family DNA binding protein
MASAPERQSPKKSAAPPTAISSVESRPFTMSPIALFPRLLGIPEAAAYISGTNWFVEELVRNNEIRAIVVGKGRKIDIRDLDAWIDSEKEKQEINPPTPIGFARVNQKMKTAA